MKGDTAESNMFTFSPTWGVFDNGTHVSYPYLQNNTQIPEPGLGTVSTTSVQDDGGGGGTYNYPPEPEFEITGTMVAGEQLTLDASASSDSDGSIQEYRWSIDSDESETGEVINHTFDEPGLHEVELTVEDDGGKQGVAEDVLRVDKETEEDDQTQEQTGSTDDDDGQNESEDGGGGATDGSDAIELPSGDLTVGDEVTLKASDTLGLDGDITGYEWTVDGEQVGTDEVVSHVLESSGEVNVTLKVTYDENTTETFSRTVSVEEAEEQIDENETDEETNEEGQVGENETEGKDDENETDDEDDDGEGLPGFTALVALVALVALALVAVRRRS
jgi:PGF-CTERM protein